MRRREAAILPVYPSAGHLDATVCYAALRGSCRASRAGARGTVRALLNCLVRQRLRWIDNNNSGGSSPMNVLRPRLIKQPRFLLMYSALQFAPEEMAKPDGSLSLCYLAGALREAKYDVDILDVSVGNAKDKLEDTFFRTTRLPSGLIRCGMSRERIIEEIADYDVIGISSIFTTQTSMVLDLIRLVKEVAPEKLVISGGVNARNLRNRFFNAGVDLICLSEAEVTIVHIAEALRGLRPLVEVRGIAFQDDAGREVINPQGPIVMNLDDLPFPAWDMLPNDKYWELSRPHGGQFPAGQRIQYAALQTTRGCPFQCLYCHISKEEENSPFGETGTFRMKSVGRVIEEMNRLKDLGAQHLFFEDDSLFAKKKRAYTLFESVRHMGFELADVNGINICHLMKNDRKGKLTVDNEFLENLSAAGFRWLHLPFESGNKRLIEKYSTSKWNIEKTDTASMIRGCTDAGIHTAGNYIIGYPDETIDEIYTTVLSAKRHVEEGLNHAAIFAMVPFPGTKIYDMCVEADMLDPDFDTDLMKWTKSTLKNTPVAPEALEYMRQLAWLTVNRRDFVEYKIGMRVNCPVEG